MATGLAFDHLIIQFSAIDTFPHLPSFIVHITTNINTTKLGFKLVQTKKRRMMAFFV
jgi:hypothetical protein